MRRALLSVAVAFAGVASVTASGWAIQAAALPAPKPAAHVAADASKWFHEYRLAVDVFHFDHRRIEGACVRGWLRGRNGSRIRASLLSFAGGPTLRITAKGHVSVLSARRQDRYPSGFLAADAGCSRVLEGTLAAAAQGAGHLHAERAYAANRPAVALEFQRGEDARSTFFVSPETAQPLVVFVDLDGHTITARVHLRSVTRSALARFGLLHGIEPEPRG